MTSIMRRTVRGTAAGLGALAIVAGTAACGGILGGGEDEADGGAGTEETQEEDGSSDAEGEDTDTAEDTDESSDSAEAEEAEEAAGSESSEDAETSEGADDAAADDSDAEDGSDDAGASEEGDAAAAEALSEDDLTAVGDTYYEFLEAAAASDGEAACSLITNPDTDEPLKSGEVKLCAEGFEGGAEESPIDPSMMDAIDRSMVEAVDNGDGTAGVTLMGQDAGVTFVDVDGSWYIDGSQFI